MENLAKRVNVETMETMVLLGVLVNKVSDQCAIEESIHFACDTAINSHLLYISFIFQNSGPRGLPGFPGPQGLVGPAGKFF